MINSIGAMFLVYTGGLQMRGIRLFAGIAVLLLFFILQTGYGVYGKDTSVDEVPGSVKGKVLEVLDEIVEKHEYAGGSFEDRSQLLKVRVTSGQHKGEIVEARHSLSGIGVYEGVELKAGDGVLMYLDLNGEG